ncbi:MAG TPA: hypothetical protein VF403_17705, partial [Kofleriaceae bacterium]
MELRGVIADAETVGDQLVRQTFGQQLHDLALALGQLASTFAIAGLDRGGGNERVCEGGIDDGEATPNSGERGLDAGSDLIAEYHPARTGGEGRGYMRRVTDDGDHGDVEIPNFGETRERLFAVDPGIPQSDFGEIAFDHVDRTDLRQQAREPGAKQRIVGQQYDLDRLAERAQGELWIAGHGSAQQHGHAGRTGQPCLCGQDGSRNCRFSTRNLPGKALIPLR